MNRNCYISIGNSDDKLTQKEWAAFVDDVDIVCRSFPVHGRWFSAPTSEYQNACWCIEMQPGAIAALKPVLSILAERYRQDSIALGIATVEFIEARG